MRINTYSLEIKNLIEVTFLNYGGIIQSIKVPDKKGNLSDVVLGFENPENYLFTHPYFGAIVGRYANRIQHGKFSIDGTDYQVPINDGPHSLHGGLKGFDKVLWEVKRSLDGQSYELTYISPNGDQGYPGNLSVTVTYTVTTRKEFIIHYKAFSTKKTPINLTNHSYFNLSGTFSSLIDNHLLWINADTYTEVDSRLIPTGRIVPVTKAMDFRKEKSIGLCFDTMDGLDHNYVLNSSSFVSPKIRLSDPTSGRVMEVLTDMPGVQVYTGNFLDGTIIGKGSTPLIKHSGLCLETQFFPDSPNNPQFPSTVLSPDQIYESRTIYRFST